MDSKNRLPRKTYDKLYKINKLVFKTFQDVKRRISKYTNLKPSQFVESVRKLSFIMDLGVSEMSLVLTNIVNSGISKTFRNICHGYRQAIDLLIDYMVKPENFNMSMSAMSMRDMKRKMVENNKKMKKYKEVALMNPEAFVKKMKLARERLNLPDGYEYDDDDWSTWDDEDDEEIEVGGIKWSKKRAKMLEKEFKKVSDVDNDQSETDDGLEKVEEYMLNVDKDAVDRLMKLINSGKVLDFSENKDYNIILALKNKIYLQMSKEHNLQRKRIDDILGFFDEVRVNPGQTNNYLENLVDDMKTTNQKPLTHEIEHQYLEEYKFRRVLDVVERDVLEAFDSKQRELVMRVLIKLNKARRRYMVDVGNHPIERWDDLVKRVEEEYLKTSQIQEKYEVLLKRSKNEKEILVTQLNNLRRDLKLKEERGDTYQENIHQLLNEVKEEKYEKIRLQKELENRDFEIYKLQQEVNEGGGGNKDDNDDILQKVHVRIDGKLEKLVNIIKELSLESRIFIDEDRNLITDHPNVEKDMFDVRNDLENVNNHYARKNQKNGKRVFKFHNTRTLHSLKHEKDVLNSTKIRKRKSKLEKFKKKKKKKKRKRRRHNTQRKREGSFGYGDDYSDSESSDSKISFLSRKKSMVPSKFDQDEYEYKTSRLSKNSNKEITIQTENKGTFCDFLKIEDAFLRELDPIKLGIVKAVANLKSDKEQLKGIRRLFQSLVDPRAARHLDFINNLLLNDNLKLLEDVTNDGKMINDELVIYIKKLRNERKGTKFEGNIKQKIFNSRMSTQDNMALNKGKNNLPQRMNTLDTRRRRNNFQSSLKKKNTMSPSKPQGRKGKSKMPALLPKMKSDYLKNLNNKIKIKLEKTEKEISSESEELSSKSEMDPQENFIKKIYNHLHLKSKKMKFWYKYPFKSIRDFNKKNKYGLLGSGSLSHRNILSDSRNQPNFEQFKSGFKDYLQRHSSCGDNCIHLQRFYDRIGFDPSNKGGARKKIDIPKFIIDKIILGDLDNV